MAPPPKANTRAAIAGPAAARSASRVRCPRGGLVVSQDAASSTTHRASTITATASSARPWNPTSAASTAADGQERRPPAATRSRTTSVRAYASVNEGFQMFWRRRLEHSLPGKLRRRPIGLRQPHAHAGAKRRDLPNGRNLHDARWREVVQLRPRAGREHQRSEGRHRDPRSPPNEEHAHDQGEAHPQIGAQQFRHERQIGPERWGQQADQQIGAVVVGRGQVRAPRESRRVKAARADRGRQPQMQEAFDNRQELAAGQRDPEERQGRDHEAGRRIHRRPQGLAGAPGQAGAERERERPGRNRPRGRRNDVQDDVDGESPERGPDDEALRQRHALIALPEHGAGDDVAHGGQRHDLRQQ